MQDLHLIYDTAFFRQWGRGNADYVRSAEIIAGALFNLFKPKSLADLGCGCGVYAHIFKAKGVPVLAVDGVQPPREHAFSLPIVVRDLTAPVENIWGMFDLALCLEVAEHIPEELSGVFLDNIVKFSGRLAMSAAPPGQDGHHHVNERPKRYWARKLAGKGFVYNRRETGRLMEALKKPKPPLMWMANHISVYEKTSDPLKLRHGVPFQGNPGSPAL